MTEHRCGQTVPGFGPCELPDRHHGPCTHGPAQAFHDGVCPNGFNLSGTGKRLNHTPCRECDLIDAREVLRLDAGGALRPLQVAPPWMKGGTRERIVGWARRLLGITGERHLPLALDV